MKKIILSVLFILGIMSITLAQDVKVITEEVNFNELQSIADYHNLDVVIGEFRNYAVYTGDGPHHQQIIFIYVVKPEFVKGTFKKSDNLYANITELCKDLDIDYIK